jgi:HD-GYP domain-containing protein (c-di-GMP phosphodiesterase class II)
VASRTYRAGTGHLTCSIGVASYPSDAETGDGLISVADRALDVAKRLGCNPVRAASDVAVTALLNAENSGVLQEDSALIGTVEALAALVQARDHYAGVHMQEVGAIARAVALILGLDKIELRTVILAAELHDIGKVAIPDIVLRKPASLTSDEWQLMHTHPVVGADVVNHVPALRGIAPIIQAHHERWDGKGYPDGQTATGFRGAPGSLPWPTPTTRW